MSLDLKQKNMQLRWHMEIKNSLEPMFSSPMPNITEKPMDADSAMNTKPVQTPEQIAPLNENGKGSFLNVTA